MTLYDIICFINTIFLYTIPNNSLNITIVYILHIQFISIFLEDIIFF